MHINSTGTELFREILLELNIAHRMVNSLQRKLDFISDYMDGSQLDTLSQDELDMIYSKIRVIEHLKNKL